MGWSAGNFRRDSRWVPVGFQADSSEMWVRFSVGRKGGIAGGLGEIGGRILNGSGGVSTSGSLWKEEAEGRDLSVDF